MFSLITFLVTISIVVVFHEYGHYLAARYYGVYVERFSVGFGKVLIKKTDSRGTEWVLSILPLGGYVKPLAEPNLSDSQYCKGASIQEKTSWQRIVIYAAGPAFSFLLGIIIYSIIFFIGEIKPSAILATPPEQSIAAQAGIMKGDKVLSVNNREVHGWEEFAEAMLSPVVLGQTVTLDVQRASGSQQTIHVANPNIAVENLEKIDWLREMGVALQAPTPVVKRLVDNGPAQRAGIKEGDIIFSINGKKVQDLHSLITSIQALVHQDIELTVLRQGSPISIRLFPDTVTLENGNEIARIQAEFTANYPTEEVSYGVFTSLRKATIKTWDTAYFSLSMMGKMLMGEVSVKNLSGPITIASYSGKVAQYGISRFLAFIALISISIGVLNLLPIPGLDGGQMLINGIELIKGKPLPERLLTTLMKVGYALLFTLMFFAVSNDITRLFEIR